jgi:hypothetical protein
MATTTVQLSLEATELLGQVPVEPAPAPAPPAPASRTGLDPATLAELRADEAATLALPSSSVPAAYDRGHLYSPSASTVAAGIAHRPGAAFPPLPDSPADPPAWKTWWLTKARVETPDYLGLSAGAAITIQHASGTGPGEVIATQRFGAVVRYPTPDGADEPYGEMYVRVRNHHGHWYR